MPDDAIAMNANLGQDLRVDLVFDGQVLPGFDPAQVQSAVAERFKLDDQRRERMFSGVPYVVKRAMTPEDATRYIDLFAALGARLRPQGSAARGDARPAAPAAMAGPSRDTPSSPTRPPVRPAQASPGSTPGSPSRPAPRAMAAPPGLALV
ncbi:MAG TPA: hypothetical protein VIN75_15675, partial [Burkholderiaceae bacterium]